MITKKNLESDHHYDLFQQDDEHDDRMYLNPLSHSAWPQTLIVEKHDLDNILYFTLWNGSNSQGPDRGIIIWKIPIILMLKLFKPLIIGSKYHIMIPSDFFWKQCINVSKGSDNITHTDQISKVLGFSHCSLRYERITFNLLADPCSTRSTGPIKYDLIVKMSRFDDQIKHSLTQCLVEYGVNLIHEFNESNYSSCPLSQFISLNHLIDTGPKDQDEMVINIQKRIQSIQSQYIDETTKITKSLCGIITEYMSFSPDIRSMTHWWNDQRLSIDDSYVIKQKNKPLKIYLSMRNVLFTFGGVQCTCWDPDYSQQTSIKNYQSTTYDDSFGSEREYSELFD